MKTKAFYPKKTMNSFPPTARGYRVVRPCTNIPKLSAATYGRIAQKCGPPKAESVTNTIKKGQYRGLPLYFVSIIERDTCDTDCPVWDACYGKNMPFAKRMNPFRKGFEPALRKDLAMLDKRHPQGFVIRLWELGDFWSIESVDFWVENLERYSTMKVFGYSHRSGEIGERLDEVFLMFPGRFAIMDSDHSTGTGVRPAAEALTKEVTDRVVGEALTQANGKTVCPQQTKRTPSCNFCGLCMDGRTEVAFLRH